MEEEEIKKQMNARLKDFNEFVKTATFFREEEQKKFLVGIYLQESIKAIRHIIPSIAQRGEAVTHRRDNIRDLQITLINLIDLSLALGVGNEKECKALKSQTLGQIGNKRRKPVKKQAGLNQRQDLQNAPLSQASSPRGNPAISRIKAIKDAELKPRKEAEKRPVKVSGKE